MAVHNKFLQSHQLEVGHVPKDITGSAQAGDYVSLKEAAGIVFLILQGAWAGGTPAVTISQATDVTNSQSDAKAVSFTEAYRKTGLSNTQWTKFTVSSDTFNLTTTANTVTAIEIGADQLDRDNGFDCVQLNVATPGANADLLASAYILYGIRNETVAASIPAATTN